MTTTRRRGAARVLGAAAAVAMVDWVTKALAATVLDDGPVELGPVLTLRLGHNPGIAFGLGDRLPSWAIIGLTAVVTLALAVAAVRGILGPWWASGAVLGGAVANLVDRVVGGTVVDFLDLGWWPSFNLADVALTTGCALLVLTAMLAPSLDGR